MSKVNFPEGWATQTAAECFDQLSTNGIKVKTKDCQASGLHPVIDQGLEFISGYIDDSEKLIKLDSPVIVFGDHTRNIKWVDFDFVPGADGTKILVPKGFLLPRLAFYGLKNLEIPDRGYSRHFKFLKELEIPVPPLTEQKIIADKLDTMLSKVETTKDRLDRIPQILKTFRQSVLSAAVTGKLTEEWRSSSQDLESSEKLFNTMKLSKKSAWLLEQEKSHKRNGKEYIKDKVLKRYPEPSDKFQDEFGLTTITKIPEQWIATNLDNVSVAVTGKTPSTTDEDNWEGDIPFISPSQILPNGTVIAPERYITPKGATKAPLLPAGAVMIVCIGTIGKVGLLDKESAFNQQINALVPSGCISSKYLFYWSQTLNAWLNKTSSAVVNAAIINKSRLCEAPCPLPSLKEQTEIVRRTEELFEFADSIEKKANAALIRVNNLTQSILAKAFRGELTADWRANNPKLISGENSAEALLVKIKIEREALVKKKPPKKHTGKKKV